ncbi:hypothetical protein L2E82_35242 [Cichorium intybus]|uniref:Uncharacterized protein n=1 Tax=Cichorium intybus TaxID=13427 RepID=A0ACB9BNF6_CICIN|nr:hypothetical protein L2E82_35242 [Cichorium intybus]
MLRYEDELARKRMQVLNSNIDLKVVVLSDLHYHGSSYTYQGESEVENPWSPYLSPPSAPSAAAPVITVHAFPIRHSTLTPETLGSQHISQPPPFALRPPSVFIPITLTTIHCIPLQTVVVFSAIFFHLQQLQ